MPTQAWSIGRFEPVTNSPRRPRCATFSSSTSLPDYNHHRASASRSRTPAGPNIDQSSRTSTMSIFETRQRRSQAHFNRSFDCELISSANLEPYHKSIVPAVAPSRGGDCHAFTAKSVVGARTLLTDDTRSYGLLLPGGNDNSASVIIIASPCNTNPRPKSQVSTIFA